MSTQAATKKRKAIYNARCLVAHEHILEAQTDGLKTAHEIAAFLNAKGVPAPSNEAWGYKSVLRAQKRLHELGLGNGTLPPWLARNYGGPRKRRERKPSKDQHWIRNVEAQANAEGLSVK